MRRPRRRLAANALLLLGSSALAVAIVEAVVRVVAPQPAYQYRFSSATYYEPIPNARFVHEREEFSIPVEYNAFGMRDRPRTPAKPAGVLRIALVGDSFAEAKEVPLDSTVAQRIERVLAAEFPSRVVEVLNFGVAGFGTAASAIRFETLGVRFAPDVVVYLFVHNDPADNVARDARLYAISDGRMVFRTHTARGATRAARSAIDWVKQNLHSYRLVRFRIDRALAAREAKQGSARGAEPANGLDIRESAGDDAWVATHLAIARLAQSARSAGAAFLVAQATTTDAAMTSRLVEICERVGAPFIDLVPVLAADAGPITFETDGHWSSRGHAVAASALAPAIATVVRGETKERGGH